MGLPIVRATRQRPPCALCGEPASNGFWDLWLCDTCSHRWSREAPRLEPLELAHAAAHPEDVEASGGHQFVNQAHWVILKPGATAQVARAAATSWLISARKAAA